MATNKLIKRIDLLTSTQMDKDALATKARDVLAAEVAKDNKRNYISCVYDVFNNKLFLALDKGIQQQYNYDTDFLEIKLTDTTTGGGGGTGGGGIIDPGTNEIIKEFRDKIIQEIIKELGTNTTELVIKLKETILKSDEFKETIKEILEGKDTLSQEIINKIKDLVINSTEFREKVLALTPEIILGIETGASIDDNAVVTDKTWSSSKIDSEIKKNIGQGGGGTTVECNCIDDTAAKTDKTYSSKKIEELIANIQGGGGGGTIIQGGNGYSNLVVGGGTTTYRLNNQLGDYTTTSDDYDGRTIIRCLKEDTTNADSGTVEGGSQTITITKPDDEFIGHTLVIRKAKHSTNGGTTTIVGGAGVTFSPADTTTITRTGASLVLLYVGNGEFDVFGEIK